MNSLNTSFLPFMYKEIHLKEACWINNEPYFTRRAIGEWLEYSQPDSAIKHVLNRNPQLDDDRWSAIVKLPTVDEYRWGHSVVKTTSECPSVDTSLVSSKSISTRIREIETRVYNPIGLQLIIFESHQPKAKAFKIAVAGLVYAFMKGELRPPRSIADLRLQIQCKEALALRPYHERALAVKYLAESHHKARSTVHSWIKRISQGEEPANKAYGKNRGRYWSMDPEDVETVRALAESEVGITTREILENMPHLRCQKDTVARIKRAVKEQVRQRVIARLEAAA